MVLMTCLHALVQGPLMLEMGVLADVAAATSATMIMYVIRLVPHAQLTSLFTSAACRSVQAHACGESAYQKVVPSEMTQAIGGSRLIMFAIG